MTLLIAPADHARTPIPQGLVIRSSSRRSPSRSAAAHIRLSNVLRSHPPKRVPLGDIVSGVRLLPDRLSRPNPHGLAITNSSRPSRSKSPTGPNQLSAVFRSRLRTPVSPHLISSASSRLRQLRAHAGPVDMLSNGRPMGRPWHGSHAASIPVDQHHAPQNPGRIYPKQPDGCEKMAGHAVGDPPDRKLTSAAAQSRPISRGRGPGTRRGRWPSRRFPRPSTRRCPPS